MELTEKKVKSEKVFSGRLLQIYKDTVELPNGHITTREYNKHTGAVCIIPIDADMNIILEHQFRYATGELLVEIPAGKLELSDSDPEEGGRRELREETGITVEKMIPLGYFYPAAAYSSEKIMMYLAEGLKFGETDLDNDEFLDVFKMPLKDFLKEVDKGNVPDLKTQAGALRAARYYGIR